MPYMKEGYAPVAMKPPAPKEEEEEKAPAPKKPMLRLPKGNLEVGALVALVVLLILAALKYKKLI